MVVFIPLGNGENLTPKTLTWLAWDWADLADTSSAFTKRNGNHGYRLLGAQRAFPDLPAPRPAVEFPGTLTAGLAPWGCGRPPKFTFPGKEGDGYCSPEAPGPPPRPGLDRKARLLGSMRRLHTLLILSPFHISPLRLALVF